MPKSFSDTIVTKIMFLGRAQQQIFDLLDHDLFQNLSKHNPYFHSEHEVEADKLDDCRRRLQVVHDTLWDIVGTMNQPYPEEE
jgi:hypothetical protein